MNERMNERKSQSKSTKSTNLTTTTKSNLTINYVTDNSGQKKIMKSPNLLAIQLIMSLLKMLTAMSLYRYSLVSIKQYKYLRV